MIARSLLIYSHLLTAATTVSLPVSLICSASRIACSHIMTLDCANFAVF
jgi:hypothetical protein